MLPLGENSGGLPSGLQPLSGMIPLSTLIEFMLQRTYHELTIMAELLPRKTDMERKIEISEFASRTRQMFVRLLALVKWANSVSKVEKCARMSTFLDQQQELFMETADSLARMARETLVHARLPSFALPCAVDVLTTGTYPRLPFCIKEKIVPPDLITPAEKKQTLERLTQIIEYRIVTSDLPAQMCNPKIGNGRVKFTVEHEFEVTLTLMGDDPNIPWRLLDIEVLVEDPETGSGQSLVHSLQVNYIHQLVQSRLMDNEKPLHELYDCLHAFCQSLQLEVLHSQAQVLIHQRGLGDSLKIEKYEMGRRLCISYWRDPIKKEGKPYQPGYKLEVHVDSTDKNKPLQLSHFPQVQGSESIKVPQAIKSDCLSLEKFFVNTIQVRSLARLKDLERELRLTVIGQCEIKDLPVVLYIPLLMPCLESEKLSVTVDTIRGCYLVSLAQKETPLTHDIEECLNSDKKDLKKLLTNLRYWLMLERCRQSLQQMPVECHDELPFINVAGHRLEALGKHCLYIRLPMQLDHYLVVEVVMPVEKGSKKPFYSYYLLKVHPEGIDTETGGGNATDASSSGAIRTIDANDLTQLFLRPGQILKLDPFALTRGQCGKVMDFESDDPSHLSRKRKLLMGGEAADDSGGKLKRPRVSTYFISELTHIVALCEDKLPLVALAGELAKRGIAHTGITVEGQGVALSLSLLQGLPCPEMPRKAAELLKNNLLSFTFRIQRKDKAIWCIENIFTNHPIKSTNIHEQGPEQRVFYYYDKMSLESIDKIVTRLVSDWNAVCHLFAAVVEFSEIYNSDNPELMKNIEIRSYNYKHLNLAYGPQKCYMVSVQYNQNEKQFKLLFGTIGQSPLPNCHTLVSTYLEKDLNSTKSVAHLSKVLVQTCSVLMSICKLSTSPIIWIKTKMLPVQMFTILPVSSVHFRIIYRSSQCLDIQCVNAFEVSIRDGAYSVFDTSRFIEGLAPIYGLQSFLGLFVDDSNVSSQARRRMTADDDNPLSPVVTDPMDAYLASSNPPSSQRNMLIAPSPSNIMSPSPGNPALLVPSSPSSFVPVPSPGSLGMHMPSPAAAAFMAGASGMVDGGGSPFPGPSGLVMPSPAAARNWPNSPMVHASPASRMGMAPSPGHPSLQASPSQHKDMDHAKMAVARMFPPRPWATLVPTILSHEALDKLLTPVAGTSSGSGGLQCSPLERFLGCTFLKRHMLRIVSSDEAITNMQVNNEPGVVMFKFSCGLQCRVFLNPTNLQSLCLKVAPVPEVQNQWDSEELAILEKFFEMKVDCEPYKPNALLTFAYILKAPMHILKDFIQIMRMEIMPDRNLKWSVQWCMLIPFGFNHISPVGSVAVTVNSRILFMLQLSRNNIALPPQQQQPPPPPSCEPQSIIVPILYDTTNNVTSTIEQKMMSMAASLPAVSQLLKNCMEFQVKPNECSILPCVRELITNLNF